MVIEAEMYWLLVLSIYTDIKAKIVLRFVRKEFIIHF